MVNQEQLKILQQGVQEWNNWRTPQIKTPIDLIEANLSGVNLREANLIGAYLNKANLSGADLRRADLREAYLGRAILRGAYLIGASLRRANLSEADFSKTLLSKANLSKANFRNTNLSEANLSGANLSGADLREANLSGADLREADLREADLREADLREADLREANFSEANLSGAKFSGASIELTIFGNLNLSTIKGLETVHQIGPSYISTSTLERSNGEIPDIFLKGAGVSDILIAYTHSLFRQPIEYYTCFISYSSKDELFARRLHNDLQQEGVRCWFAPEDMDIGDKIRHRIDESIRLYDKLLLILSEHSITSSWVEYEVERALNKEPQGTHNVLYPVRVDQTVMTCNAVWARDIKSTRHIGNFENWTDPQQYEENFQRLLRALNSKKEQQEN